MPIQIKSPQTAQVINRSLVLAYGNHGSPHRLMGLLLGPPDGAGVPSIQVHPATVAGNKMWVVAFRRVAVGGYRLVVLDAGADGFLTDPPASVTFSVAQAHPGFPAGPSVWYPITGGTFATNDWVQGSADPDVTSVTGTMTPTAGGAAVNNDMSILSPDQMTHRIDFGLHFVLSPGVYNLVVTQFGGANSGLFAQVNNITVA